MNDIFQTTTNLSSLAALQGCNILSSDRKLKYIKVMSLT